jgi:S-adenosylmethionine:tRNA ribosyltransferase-isomerase
MIAADRPDAPQPKLFVIDRNGTRHLPRSALPSLFDAGDLIVANDAATLPASLHGEVRGQAIEVRLAGWVSVHDPGRFVAFALGAGDHRTRTEDRPPAPPLAVADRISLGPLSAEVEQLIDARLFVLRFLGSRAAILAGLAVHGRPIQYAHVPERLALWDVWTRIAADPVAFEAPSAGFALDWRTMATWRRRGIGFTTLTHAAGISSTGDPALDARLPFDEPYYVPVATATAVNRVRSQGGRLIAIGTTVVRALESAADPGGCVQAGAGMARGRIGPERPPRVVDAVLSGVHQPGESHFELLRAFAEDAVLSRMSAALELHGYRTHEFGDSLLIERSR